mgnify:CR=1 FL=1
MPLVPGAPVDPAGIGGQQHQHAEHIEVIHAGDGGTVRRRILYRHPLGRAAGAAGVPVVEYNFYAHRAMEGYFEEIDKDRGDSGWTGFDFELIQKAGQPYQTRPEENGMKFKDLPPLANEGAHTVDEMWKNITYFLKAVVPVAEESGLIVGLTDLVLKRACDQLRQWQLSDSRFARLGVQVNLSDKDLAQPGLARRVGAALQDDVVLAVAVDECRDDARPQHRLQRAAHGLQRDAEVGGDAGQVEEALVDDITDLSQIETGAVSLERREVDAGDVERAAGRPHLGGQVSAPQIHSPRRGR